MKKKKGLGKYLADATGRSLYVFLADSAQTSSCYEACAKVWPPFLTKGTPVAKEGAQSDLLGTIRRKDGSMQVTYNGWPLYYFAKDKQPGDTKGQDMKGFGAEWYLLSPKGKIVEAEGGEHSEGK